MSQNSVSPRPSKLNRASQLKIVIIIIITYFSLHAMQREKKKNRLGEGGEVGGGTSLLFEGTSLAIRKQTRTSIESNQKNDRKGVIIGEGIFRNRGAARAHELDPFTLRTKSNGASRPNINSADLSSDP